MATAFLVPLPRAVFYDPNGAPLAGGFVNTYVPGGTSPKTTWADAGETTPNSNPITLDANGSALIYGSGAYQLTVTDALGNAVPAYSGLTGSGASASGISDAMVPVVSASTTAAAGLLLGLPSVSNIAALRALTTVTSSSPVYVQGYFSGADGGEGVFWVNASDTTSADNAGTIIVDTSGRRWYRETNGGPWAVAWFGAIGGGSHDDTAGIQAAIDAIPTLGGGSLLLGPKPYVVSSSININKPAICISGCGVSATKIFIPKHDFDVFKITTPSCVISDMSFAGDTPASGSTAFYIIADDSTAEAAFNMQVINITAGFIHSFILSQSSLGFFSNCYAQDLCTTFGVGYTINQLSNAGQGTIINCTCQNAGGSDARAGILILSSATLTAINCQMEKMGNAVWVVPNPGLTVFSVKLVNVWSDTSSGTGILLDGRQGSIERFSATGGWAGSCGVGVRTFGLVNGFSIQDYDIFANLANGIDIDTSTETTGLMISGNRIAGNTANGIVIGAGVLNFGIVNNTIGAYADFGGNGGDGVLVVTGAADDYMITDNRLRNNSGTSLVDGGTGTSKVVANNLT